MHWRVRPLLTLVAVIASAIGMSGCSLSNSSTARSTPTPASDQPYPTPTPAVQPTPTPTPSPRLTATPTSTPTPTPTVTASPSPSPEPTTAAKVVYGYLDSVARTDEGYTAAYRTATRCVAVKAPLCTPKPDDLLADGSWLARPAKQATTTKLAPKATGEVVVHGKTVKLTLDALTPLPAPGGLVVDLRSDPLPVKITLTPAVTTITQLH